MQFAFVQTSDILRLFDEGKTPTRKGKPVLGLSQHRPVGPMRDDYGWGVFGLSTSNEGKGSEEHA